MKILVTGATGFIGSSLIPLLAGQGHKIIATYRTAGRDLFQAGRGNVVWKPLDVFDPPRNPYEFLGSPDRMIHLSWSGLPNYKDEFHLTENLPADKAFLMDMMRGGLDHLLVVGTCFEYGMQEGKLREDSPCLPGNPYGKAKVLLRQFLEVNASEMGKVFQWARLFYLYGPGQSPRSLFAQLDAALESGADSFDMSGGQQIRDYLSVNEVARCLAAIVAQDEVTGVINVCSGRDIPLVDLVREYLTAKRADIKLNLGIFPYPDWEPFCFWGNTAKLDTVIGLKSKN